MKTAIIYISRHGTTETVSQQIKDQLAGAIDIIDLKTSKKIALTEYDRVILGGSIHMGQVHKKTKAFIEKNLEELLQKELGLFLCCMEQGEKAKEQYELAFPEKLRDHALVNSFMGFEYLLEKMGFLEKKMVKKITGKENSFSKIDEDAIQEFVSHFS